MIVNRTTPIGSPRPATPVGQIGEGVSPSGNAYVLDLPHPWRSIVAEEGVALRFGAVPVARMPLALAFGVGSDGAAPHPFAALDAAGGRLLAGAPGSLGAPRPFVDMLRPRRVWECGPLRGEIKIAGRDSWIEIRVGDAASPPTLDDLARMFFVYVQLRWGGHVEYVRGQILDTSLLAGETMPLVYNGGPPNSFGWQFARLTSACAAASATAAGTTMTRYGYLAHFRDVMYPDILARLRGSGATESFDDLSAATTKALPFYMERQHRAVLYRLAQSLKGAAKDTVRSARNTCVREALLREGMKTGRLMDALVTYIVETMPSSDLPIRGDFERMEAWAKTIATERRLLAAIAKDGVQCEQPELIERLRKYFPWPCDIRQTQTPTRTYRRGGLAEEQFPPPVQRLSAAYVELIRKEVTRAKVPPERRTRVEAEIQRRVRTMIQTKRLPQEPAYHVQNTIGAMIVAMGIR